MRGQDPPVARRRLLGVGVAGERKKGAGSPGREQFVWRDGGSGPGWGEISRHWPANGVRDCRRTMLRGESSLARRGPCISWEGERPRRGRAAVRPRARARAPRAARSGTRNGGDAGAASLGSCLIPECQPCFTSSGRRRAGAGMPRPRKRPAGWCGKQRGARGAVNAAGVLGVRRAVRLEPRVEVVGRAAGGAAAAAATAGTRARARPAAAGTAPPARGW